MGGPRNPSPTFKQRHSGCRRSRRGKRGGGGGYPLGSGSSPHPLAPAAPENRREATRRLGGARGVCGDNETWEAHRQGGERCFLTTCQQRGEARLPTTVPRVVSGRNAATAIADAASTKGPPRSPAGRTAGPASPQSHSRPEPGAGRQARFPGTRALGAAARRALPFLLFILELPFQRGAPPGSRGAAGRSGSAGGRRLSSSPEDSAGTCGTSPSSYCRPGARVPGARFLGGILSDTWASSCRDLLAACRGPLPRPTRSPPRAAPLFPAPDRRTSVLSE